MPRRLTRAQILENRAFLKALERTGNIRLAARQIGVAYGTIQHRRRVHPVFAQRIDAALAFAQARLAAQGGAKRPGKSAGEADPHRTRGGEAVVVALPDGGLQMRAAHPGKLTRDCEQAFLAALSATANVRLSAAAAGASVAAFYRRRRRNPAFAREMRLALETGYERIECALIEGWLPEAHQDDAWRHNDPPPVPAMTASQALQLLYLHQKEARLLAEPDHIKRRRGESGDAQSFRLAAMYRLGQERLREAFQVAEAARRAAGMPSPFEPAPPRLPALDQVTGWSTADPAKTPHHEGVALFGGWRIEDMGVEKMGPPDERRPPTRPR
ncbi:MAG: hypothetical protein ACTHM8_08720 [Sphingomonas sp.]